MTSNWAWSFSKSILLRRCPFAFKNSLSQPKQHGLEKFNLSALAGVAIHSSIAHEIDLWSTGNSVSPNESIKRAIDFFNQVWKNRRSQLIEVINGYSPDESLLKFSKIAITTKLQRFYYKLWPQFSKYEHILHEKLDKFKMEGVDIIVKVDLACRSYDGYFYIIDWKTGLGRNENDWRTQLAVYSLWASLKMKEKISTIRPTLVNLVTGEVTSFRPTNGDIKSVRELIHADINTVRSYEANQDYLALPETRKCLSCAYLRACDEGKKKTSGEKFISTP